MTQLAKTALAAAAAVGAMSAAGLARAEGGPGLSQCFSTQDIKQTIRADARHINVSTRDGRYFQITTRNDCRSSGVTDPLVINTGGGSGLICKPVDMTLSSGIGVSNTPCLVDSITPMTKEQVAALPAKNRP